MLGIDPGRIAAHGAVSAEVARAMAEGALVHSEATWAVAVTGIAGPAGATPGKPVGTVWLAIGRRGGAPACSCCSWSATARRSARRPCWRRCSACAKRSNAALDCLLIGGGAPILRRHQRGCGVSASRNCGPLRRAPPPIRSHAISTRRFKPSQASAGQSG